MVKGREEYNLSYPKIFNLKGVTYRISFYGDALQVQDNNGVWKYLDLDKNNKIGEEMKKKSGRPKKIAAVDLSRWTILIPWETRISVSKAAQRQNKNLNAWIDNVLLSASRDVLQGKKEVAKPEDVMDVIKQMADKIDKLSDKVNKPWWKRMVK
jgi:predicted HicB family RNase H-like nuclease